MYKHLQEEMYVFADWDVTNHLVQLLDQNVDMNAVWKKEMSLLAFASRNSCLETVGAMDMM